VRTYLIGRLFSQFKGVKLVNGEYPKKQNNAKEGVADPRRALKCFAKEGYKGSSNQYWKERYRS